MAKKILSFVLVFTVLLTLLLSQSITASALSQGDLSFTVNGNGTTIYILDQVSGNGTPVSLGPSSFTVNRSNYGNFGWIDSDNNKAYYALVVSLPSNFTFTSYGSDGDPLDSYTQSDLGYLPSTNLVGFIVPMENDGSFVLSYKTGAGNTQRMIYLEFDIDDPTPAPDPDPDPEPDPDDPYYEPDSDVLFSINADSYYEAGIMVDGASPIFYYDVGESTLRCGFNSANHPPITEMSGHVKKYKVTLYNVPDGTFLSFHLGSQITTFRTDYDSSVYTYIINSDSIPELSLAVTYSDEQDDIWETYTIWIEIRDTFAQGYYQGYDVGFNEGYQKALDDIGDTNIVNDFVQVLTNPIRAIMSFQLADFGGTVITIGNIFYTLIGIFLIIAFLKMFAGG